MFVMTLCSASCLDHYLKVWIHYHMSTLDIETLLATHTKKLLPRPQILARVRSYLNLLLGQCLKLH